MAHITDNLFTLMTIGSVEAKSGSIIVCPKKCRREILDVSSLSRNFNGCYANSNMILAFIIEKRVFVCPKTKQKIETLVEAGLKKAHVFVLLTVTTTFFHIQKDTRHSHCTEHKNLLSSILLQPKFQSSASFSDKQIHAFQ